ncbi:MAG TPA: M48 family metalloprotease [Terriglobia bacterium]|nr:M48 family metalloprotease [Terriglobia bacterium]
MRIRLCQATTLFLLFSLARPAQARPPEDPASDYRLANKALETLLATPLAKTLPNLPWHIQIVESWHVNAYSNGRGEIAITRGLAWVLGDRFGVWAAAIAHELGHAILLYTAYQPGFEAQLRRDYQAAGGDLHDPDAEEALRLTRSRGGLLDLSGQRRTEYEADRLGVLLMAEAGFHPDFAVALDRSMRSTLGDQAKFSEFLLTHPLWLEREEETVRHQKVALTLFNHSWPDPAHSPGGVAPPIGAIQSVQVSTDPKDRTLLFSAALDIRNAHHRTVRLAATLLDGRHKVHAALPAYRAPDGTLAVNVMLPDFTEGHTEATVRIPAAAVEGEARNLKAVLFLVADDWTLSFYFEPVELPR